MSNNEILLLLIAILFVIIVITLACLIAHKQEKEQFNAKIDLLESTAIASILLFRFFKSSKSVSNYTTKQSSKCIFSENSFPPQNANRDNNCQ